MSRLSTNEVKQLISGIKAADGDGVQLTRLISHVNKYREFKVNV